MVPWGSSMVYLQMCLCILLKDDFADWQPDLFIPTFTAIVKLAPGWCQDSRTISAKGPECKCNYLLHLHLKSRYYDTVTILGYLCMLLCCVVLSCLVGGAGGLWADLPTFKDGPNSLPLGRHTIHTLHLFCLSVVFNVANHYLGAIVKLLLFIMCAVGQLLGFYNRWL